MVIPGAIIITFISCVVSLFLAIGDAKLVNGPYCPETSGAATYCSKDANQPIHYGDFDFDASLFVVPFQDRTEKNYFGVDVIHSGVVCPFRSKYYTAPNISRYCKLMHSLRPTSLTLESSPTFFLGGPIAYDAGSNLVTVFTEKVILTDYSTVSFWLALPSSGNYSISVTAATRKGNEDPEYFELMSIDQNTVPLECDSTPLQLGNSTERVCVWNKFDLDLEVVAQQQAHEHRWIALIFKLDSGHFLGVDGIVFSGDGFDFSKLGNSDFLEGVANVVSRRNFKSVVPVPATASIPTTVLLGIAAAFAGIAVTSLFCACAIGKGESSRKIYSSFTVMFLFVDILLLAYFIVGVVGTFEIIHALDEWDQLEFNRTHTFSNSFLLLNDVEESPFRIVELPPLTKADVDILFTAKVDPQSTVCNSAVRTFGSESLQCVNTTEAVVARNICAHSQLIAYSSTAHKQVQQQIQFILGLEIALTVVLLFEYCTSNNKVRALRTISAIVLWSVIVYFLSTLYVAVVNADNRYYNEFGLYCDSLTTSTISDPIPRLLPVTINNLYYVDGVANWNMSESIGQHETCFETHEAYPSPDFSNGNYTLFEYTFYTANKYYRATEAQGYGCDYLGMTLSQGCFHLDCNTVVEMTKTESQEAADAFVNDVVLEGYVIPIMIILALDAVVVTCNTFIAAYGKQIETKGPFLLNEFVST